MCIASPSCDKMFMYEVTFRHRRQGKRLVVVPIWHMTPQSPQFGKPARRRVRAFNLGPNLIEHQIGAKRIKTSSG